MGFRVMRRILRGRSLLWAALLAVVSCLYPARSSYSDAAPKWTDADLLRFSDVVVRGRVAGVGVARDERVDSLYTYVTLDVVEVLEGPVRDRRITIKQLGGRLGSEALEIAGQPTFTAGEDVVLFLELRPRDHTLATTAQWQGKFGIAPAGSTGEVALRHDPQFPARGILGDDVRPLAPWLAALRRAIADAHPVDAGQFIDVTPREARDAVAVTGAASGVPASWRANVASRLAVRVDVTAGSQAGWPAGGERQIRQAADFWTGVGPVELAPGGLSPPGCLFSRNTDGRIVFGVDACGELSLRGGTLALGGGWVRFEDGRTAASPDGASYLSAGVMTNPGPAAARLLTGAACFERVVTHELGHAIGVGHTSDRTGLSGSFLQCDGGFGTITSPADRRDRPRLLAMTTTAVATRASPLQPTAAAAAPTFDRVSIASDGTEANGASRHPALSGDARFVAFESDATNLVSGDTNGVTDVFVHDRLTGVTTRESLGPGGVQANDASYGPEISSNGRFVAFVSNASNLVPGVGGSQIYVRDRQIQVTYVVSASTAGTPANAPARSPSISHDGRFISFDSTATNLVTLDTNDAIDVFTHDLSTGATTRDSVNPDGSQASGSSLSPSLSGDGRYVAFTSTASNIVASWIGSEVVVRDRLTGQVSVESMDPEVIRYPVIPSAGVSSISADGRYVAFDFSSFPAYHGVYVRDRETSRTTLIVLTCIRFCLLSAPKLSADGRFVTYVEDRSDAVVFDQATGQYSRVRLGSGNGPSDPAATAVTGAQRLLAVASLDPLVVNDTNGAMDIFVVRLGESSVPGAPTTLTASASGPSVMLRWNAPLTGGAVSDYVLEAGSSRGAADLARFGTGSTATTFSVSPVAVGTYYVRVKASNGEGISMPSNEAVLTVTSPCSLPASPNVLTTSVSGSTVTLAWTGGNGATSYILDVGSASGRSDTLVADLGSPATTLTATDVAAGTYFARVRSTNICGTSGPSNEASVIVR